MKSISVGSLCSGIEAASVAWDKNEFDIKWFAENAKFPSKVLATRYPNQPNFGDINLIEEKILKEAIDAPDLICGGTPCQAFSLAGWKKGLDDDRGNLTLKFVKIVDAVDTKRVLLNQKPCIALWENVEGVLRDKTNPFGCLISSLAGFDSVLTTPKWPRAGLLKGPRRNIAWRILDAKFFGLPQQRRRLYVLSSGKDVNPENILFDLYPEKEPEVDPNIGLSFSKNGSKINLFRSYTDCLYSAYGTKWNGNAAAFNGSLFIVQDGKIRRLTPLETERLMGFPDNYTDIEGAKSTNRYQATGNSWSVPVIKWIGNQILNYPNESFELDETNFQNLELLNFTADGHSFFNLSDGKINLPCRRKLNSSAFPKDYSIGSLQDIVETNAPQKYYLSPAGCGGILRRSRERNLKINPKLERVLSSIESKWSKQKIEEISRRQKRGKFSDF